MESLSIWDQKNRKFVRRGFRPAKITIEFQRTKTIKIADHTLAEINFDFKKDINADRDQAIFRDIKKLDTSGFRYESVGNVYLPDGEVLVPNTEEEFGILAHGTPVPGELEGGRENCAVEGMICTDGENNNCKPGKCLVGKLKQISKYKWKYTSEASYGGVKAEYYIGGTELLELKTLIRGRHKNPDGTIIGIDKPASKATTILLPPKNYLENIFSNDFLKFFNYTLGLDGTDTISGIVSTEEDFIRRVIKLAYRKVAHTEIGPMYSSLADASLSEEVYVAVEDLLFQINSVWKEKILGIMTLRWENRFARHETNRQFISYVLRDLKTLFSNCIQITKSGLKQSRIRSISDENTRPIYFRLPSAALSYRPEEHEDTLIIGEEIERFNIPISALEIGTVVTLSDRSIAYQFLPRVISDEDERRNLGLSPVLSERTKSELYSPKDPQSWYRVPNDRLPKAPVAKWILAGADEFLREKKHNIESFYYTYLDPTECSPKNLDWLAQHVGLSAPLWNREWTEEHKRALIKNALGWYDRSLIQSIGTKQYKTIKGEVLNSHPFTSLPWRSTSDALNDSESDISEIDLSKISNIIMSDVLSQEIEGGKSFVDHLGQLVDNFSIYKEEWDGLMESKGSILTLAFLFSLFEIKSHVAEELEASNVRINNGKITATLRPKSGLRAQEISAPCLLPTKFELAQVGTTADYAIGSYTNQLVADRTSVSDPEQSRNMFFRLPYYYNRDGRTWDIVEAIAAYWTNTTLNTKVQYAYLSADLWKTGDAFFEPNILINEDVLSSNAILTEEGRYLTTEDNSPIITS